MPEIPLQLGQILFTAAMMGVASHIAVFRRFEAVDRHPAMVLSMIWLGQMAVMVGLWGYSGVDMFLSYMASLAVTTTFVVSLLTSIVIYRTFFHPLRHFPGPFAARPSKLYALVRVVKSGFKWHYIQGELREQYGDYVRSGPRELIVFDPAVIPIVNGVSSKFVKGPWYDMLEPSLHGFRDKQVHSQRRKIWDKAFSIKSLSEFRPEIEGFTSTLVTQLGKFHDQELVATDWFKFYSYDVMSFMSFGIPMDMMEAGIPNAILETLSSSITIVGLFSHTPWIVCLFMTFPRLLKPLQDMTRWSRELVVRRKALKTPRPDLFKHILEIDDGTPQAAEWLMADARLAVAAGSDTVATALTVIFLYLAGYPEQLKKLQCSIDELLSSGRGYDCTKATLCPHLEGVINEVLRLHPGVPSGVQRQAPPEGITIGGKYIPGGTIVTVPMYHVGRDEINFERALEFIPERWYSQSELIKDKKAFLAFGSGPYGCVGKGLAMMSLRSVVSQIVKRFDFKLTLGFDVDKYLYNIEDHFNAAPPPLKLIFTRRS